MLLDYDGGVKLVDFGLSNTFKNDELLKTACGSPCYAAPEMIAGKRYNGSQVDIWSCGVVLFALLSGYLPFEDPNTGKLYKKILAADYQLPDHVSREAADLIGKILTTDPEKRITIPKIRKHPWFNLVECTLSKQPGTLVGRATPPFDPHILTKIEKEYKIKPSYTIQSLEANHHNSVTAIYFLLLKQHLRAGGVSIADSRLKSYNKDIFAGLKRELDLKNRLDLPQSQQQ